MRLLDHYGLRSTRINRGQSHENGVAEHSHYRLKDAVDQALILRGSRDFRTGDDYARFVGEMVEKRNRLVRGKLEQEVACLESGPESPGWEERYRQCWRPEPSQHPSWQQVVIHAEIAANFSGGDAAVGVIARITDYTSLVPQQGQIRHRGRQVQLEFGLDPSEVARLTDAQLFQSSQSMLRHHPSLPVLVVVGALLQRPGLLQQAFLWVDQHLPSFPAFGRKVPFEFR